MFLCLTCDLLVIKTQIYLAHGSSQLVTMECLGIVTASGWRSWDILESESGGIADIIPTLPYLLQVPWVA